jgi:hypoxanthine phosphoribosyltransferase
MSLDLLISAERIGARVKELAREIESIPHERPLVLIGVLKGSIHFLSDLSRQIAEDVEIDFMQTSSYGQAKSSSGIVQIRKDLDIDIKDRDVVIVEDIVDTGMTLNQLRELLNTRCPRSLGVVALLSKIQAKKTNIPLEFVGFEICDEFVVGYGLDFAEKYRNLPFVAILRED